MQAAIAWQDPCVGLRAAWRGGSITWCFTRVLCGCMRRLTWIDRGQLVSAALAYAAFCVSFQVHIMALEAADQESQQALLVGMEYLLSISFVDDDEVRLYKCTPL